MSFCVPEEFRLKTHPALGSDASYGNNGVFIVPMSGKYQCNLSGDTELQVVASDGRGWEHVSVALFRLDRDRRTPTWGEMCFIKDLFWDAEDTVVQYHPPKSQYVNYNPYVLHLWRPVNREIPLPDSKLVGPK